MNKSLFAIAILAASAFTSSAFAADEAPKGGDGTVYFDGEIILQGCDVAVVGDKDNHVRLGKVAIKSFPSAGSTAGAKQFALKLTNCPKAVTDVDDVANSGVAVVRFDGTQIAGNDSILALTQETGVATGVGIQIADNQNKVINLHEDSSDYPITNKDNLLKFVARYVSVADTVTAGPANAVSNFTVSYQ